MMPCLSASRSYRPSPLSSPTSTTCSSSCAGVSDTKSTSISSSGSEISSLFVTQKRPRTRRKRPQQMYNEAAAALSAIYPKIFSQRNSGPHRKKIDSKLGKKIEPLRFKEAGAPELFSQEVPTLIGRVREVEETELLCNEGIPPELKSGIGDQAARRRVSRQVENDSDDSKFKSLSLSEVDVDVSCPSSFDSSGSEYKCFLESSDGDIDGGVMSSIMGSDANPETEDGFGVFGFVQGTEYNLQSSAIRSLRRTSDSMVCPVFDHSFPRLKLSDRSTREEKNTLFFSSVDLFKRDNSQHRLKLQLNYEDVINAWSGPLYRDEAQDPQMVPDDSYSDSMATNMIFDVVPDLGFWSSAGDGFYGQMEDRSSTILEDGKINGSGVREASVLRYKEKRRTRLFSKKIRYEVRKLNAERRPRMKGRFVRRLADL